MSFRFRNVLSVSLLSAVAFLAAGCTEPENVRSGTESRPTRPAVPTVPADQQQFRTLAAMIPNTVLPNPEERNPADRGEWFFLKFSGPASEIAKHEAAFRHIVQTVEVVNSPTAPLAWNLPPGWVEGEVAKGRMAIATLKPGSKDSPIELTITRAGGTVLMNVNRWRGQLGLEPVVASSLDASLEKRSIAGRLTLLVDMAGPKDPALAAKAAMPMTSPH